MKRFIRSSNTINDASSRYTFEELKDLLKRRKLPWDAIADDFYQDFCDDAYEIVESTGFTDLYTETSTRGSRQGLDYFAASLNDQRYSGSCDLEYEEAKFKEIYLSASTYEAACKAAAAWYADMILDTLSL